jgi:ribose 5-phosphate isomerase B
MIVAIGADHRGRALRTRLLATLQAAGHRIVDCGCRGGEPADYPVPAFAVGEAVAAGRADRGILICGSGIGMCMAANKVPGVRAALCHDAAAARQTREHNDANVLCLSGDRIAGETAVAIAEAFLGADFAGGRHGRRVDLISAYEARTSRREEP